MLWVNHAFCTISGYARQEVIGQNASLLKSGFQGGEFYAEMWRHIRQDGQWSGEIWNRRKDGEAYAEWLTIKAVPDSGREPRYVGIFSDISKHKRAEETIKHLTYYDAVTRLPNRYLFEEVGLQGDRDTYDDPANAVIPSVIARKRGLPITLSILWLEVARRLGFQAEGVALPGHFITGLRTDLGLLHFDPFNGGRALGEEAAAQLVARATGGRTRFVPEMLEPVSNRAILVRLVRNLHVRYLRGRVWEEALWTATHLVLLAPGEAQPLRDRALVHFQRGEIEAGVRDLGEAIRLGQEIDAELKPWVDRLQRG